MIDSGKDGAFEELVTQCKEDEIDAVLGDFNMSTSLHNQSGRCVGMSLCFKSLSVVLSMCMWLHVIIITVIIIVITLS